MKNKRLIALIVGTVCLVILIVALVWSLTRSPKNPELQEGNPPSQGEEQPSQTPTPPAEKEPDQPDPVTPDKPKDPITPPDENKPTEDEPVNHKPVDNKPTENNPSNNNVPSEGNGVTGTSGSLNPNPTTKEEIEAVLNSPYMILVNRERKVNSSYVGSNLVTYTGDYKLNKTCADALRQFISAGKKAGYGYILYSGYRSYSSQYNKYYNKISYWEKQGKSHEEAVRLTDEYYAPPGGSEHHTGLAADVCIPKIVNKYACLHENYDQTEEFRWFSAHAHEYGFILRYPKGAEKITGYNYEPWHYRYVGKEIAAEIYKRGITLEEYVEELEARLKALG